MLGQLSPGSTVKFIPVTWTQALQLKKHHEDWLNKIEDALCHNRIPVTEIPPWLPLQMETAYQDPKLFVIVPTHPSRPEVVFCQV